MAAASVQDRDTGGPDRTRPHYPEAMVDRIVAGNPDRTSSTSEPVPASTPGVAVARLGEGQCRRGAARARGTG
ncbi:hypothetical protein [Microtetraspora glauca]|uniref:Transposase n=1 Tax=Microtetraspora glauca TaxID=1996 RepID=A0ABV3GKJ0_MICGL